MEIYAKFVSVGCYSFASGFVALRTNLFDEIRRNPEAVCARLMNLGQWELAEWVIDEFVPMTTTIRRK